MTQYALTAAILQAGALEDSQTASVVSWVSSAPKTTAVRSAERPPDVDTLIRSLFHEHEIYVASLGVED